MTTGKSKKQVVAAAKKKAVAAPLRALDAKARLMVAEYADTMDMEQAADTVGLTKVELEAYKENRNFMACITKIDNLSHIAADWNKTVVQANAAKLSRILMESMEAGEMKAANAAVRLIETGLNSHGLGKKENAGSAPQINVQINLQGDNSPNVRVVSDDGEKD